jgi:NAD-dependent SIR2 family protein deacetylase
VAGRSVKQGIVVFRGERGNYNHGDGDTRIVMLAIIWNQSALDDLAEIVSYSKLHCRLSGSDPDH